MHRPLEKWRLKVLEAANIMEEKGWCRGRRQNEQGQVCMIGAMILANYGSISYYDATANMEAFRKKYCYPLSCFLRKQGFHSILHYNDHVAQSEEQVATMLRRFAIEGEIE